MRFWSDEDGRDLWVIPDNLVKNEPVGCRQFAERHLRAKGERAMSVPKRSAEVLPRKAATALRSAMRSASAPTWFWVAILDS